MVVDDSLTGKLVSVDVSRDENGDRVSRWKAPSGDRADGRKSLLQTETVLLAGTAGSPGPFPRDDAPPRRQDDPPAITHSMN